MAISVTQYEKANDRIETNNELLSTAEAAKAAYEKTRDKVRAAIDNNNGEFVTDDGKTVIVTESIYQTYVNKVSNAETLITKYTDQLTTDKNVVEEYEKQEGVKKQIETASPSIKPPTSAAVAAAVPAVSPVKVPGVNAVCGNTGSFGISADLANKIGSALGAAGGVATVISLLKKGDPLGALAVAAGVLSLPMFGDAATFMNGVNSKIEQLNRVSIPMGNINSFLSEIDKATATANSMAACITNAVNSNVASIQNSVNMVLNATVNTQQQIGGVANNVLTLSNKVTNTVGAVGSLGKAVSSGSLTRVVGNINQIGVNSSSITNRLNIKTGALNELSKISNVTNNINRVTTNISTSVIGVSNAVNNVSASVSAVSSGNPMGAAALLMSTDALGKTFSAARKQMKNPAASLPTSLRTMAQAAGRPSASLAAFGNTMTNGLVGQMLAGVSAAQKAIGIVSSATSMVNVVTGKIN